MKRFVVLSISICLMHFACTKSSKSKSEKTAAAEASEDGAGVDEYPIEEADGSQDQGENSGAGEGDNTSDGAAGEAKSDSGGVNGGGLKVPQSQMVVYRPLGLTKGGYQSIKEAEWPDKCVKGDLVPTTGPLFPFNEAQTLVVRGPLVLSDLIVYRKSADKWIKLSDIGSLKWNENNFGAIKNLGTYPRRSKVLENGRELYTAIPGTGEKIVIARLKMPRASGPVFNSAAQDDVPALWMLNSRIFQPPSGQYFCNCRGLGNPGGCGELDIAEIIPENKTQVTTTIYTYEGARGGVLSKPRPTNAFQIYAAILRSDGTKGEVSVIEASSFDFSVKEFPDSFVVNEWLPSATILNKGSESLNPPSQ